MLKIDITETQKQIITFLYRFRFTTVSQLQRYLNHKDPHRIKEWLKDLKEKGCIYAIKDTKDITKPYIYCLDTKARYFLLENKKVDTLFLGRLYKEKKSSEKFINHCLFIVDIFLFFLARQEKESKLHFLTQQDIKGYDYFPEELPDVYIALEKNGKTSRYFLELFDEYKSQIGKQRFAVKKYISYFENGDWQANTDNSPLPKLLFVLPNERRKNHIYHYAKALLENSVEDISLFLTTIDAIKFSKPATNVWKKVDSD